MLSFRQILGHKDTAERLSDGLGELKAKPLHRLLCWKGAVSRSGITAAVSNVIRPKGPGTCDYNATERAANILTTIPYVAVGVHTMRNRRTAAGKVYGGSLIGVGMASGIFHASTGRWRAVARKIDYWTCAVSATCLSRCLFPEMPNVIFGASLGMIPFRPLLVTSLNAVAAEMQFYRYSKVNEQRLKTCQMQHNASFLVGTSIFCLDDKQTKVPLVHASWHLASSAALATTNGLLLEVERGNRSSLTDDRTHSH